MLVNISVGYVDIADCVSERNCDDHVKIDRKLHP